MSKPSILFIFTSADKCLDGRPAGWYLPEAAHPYDVLKSHFTIESASTKGGLAPISQESVDSFKDDGSVNFLSDPQAKKLWSETKKIKDVKVDDYAAIFVVGGHGPVIDLAFDKDFAKLAGEFYAAKKPVSAVCHGPAALVMTTKPGSDESIFHGIDATGFTNEEEKIAGYDDYKKVLPFSLEDKMGSLGAKFGKAAKPYESFVVYDGGVLTGQNPQSAGPLGERLKDILLNSM